MPSEEAKQRKCMKKYHEAKKDKTSVNATPYSEEHDRREYH